MVSAKVRKLHESPSQNLYDDHWVPRMRYKSPFWQLFVVIISYLMRDVYCQNKGYILIDIIKKNTIYAFW